MGDGYVFASFLRYQSVQFALTDMTDSAITTDFSFLLHTPATFPGSLAMDRAFSSQGK